MTIRFGDMIEQIRNNIINHIEYITNNCMIDEQNNKAILYYFYKMRSYNYDLYKNIIGLLASDHYKIINYLQLSNQGVKEDDTYITLYESLSSQDELVTLIEEEPFIILEIINYINEFSSYDYFEKRQIYLKCKDKLDVLINLSPYSALDYLYYCQKYDINILKIIYKEQLEIYDNDKNIAINNLIATLEELFNIDVDNYKELMSDLLRQYYIIGKKQLNSSKKVVKKDYLSKNIRLIENIDIIDIFNRLLSKDCKLLIEVLRRNLNNKDEDIYSYQSSELEQKTLRKIKDIKKIKIIE